MDSCNSQILYFINWSGARQDISTCSKSIHQVAEGILVKPSCPINETNPVGVIDGQSITANVSRLSSDLSLLLHIPACVALAVDIS